MDRGERGGRRTIGQCGGPKPSFDLKVEISPPRSQKGRKNTPSAPPQIHAKKAHKKHCDGIGTRQKKGGGLEMAKKGFGGKEQKRVLQGEETRAIRKEGSQQKENRVLCRHEVGIKI